jgi:hypothetical protein
MLQPTFREQSPTPFNTSTEKCHELRLSTWLPIEEPFPPYVCPRAVRRSHFMQPCLSAGGERLLLDAITFSGVALPLSSRIAQDGGSRRRRVLHGMKFTLLSSVFVHKLIQAARHERRLPPRYRRSNFAVGRNILTFLQELLFLHTHYEMPAPPRNWLP